MTFFCCFFPSIAEPRATFTKISNYFKRICFSITFLVKNIAKNGLTVTKKLSEAFCELFCDSLQDENTAA